MKRAIYIAAVIAGLAQVPVPVSLMAAQRGAAPAKNAGLKEAAGAFLQLQNWASSGQDLKAVPAPTAVPADVDQSWANRFDKGYVPRPETDNRSMCSSSGEECGRAKNEGFSVLGTKPADLPRFQSVFQAFRNITQNQWYLTFPEGRALTDGSIGLFISRKSLIGTYRYDLNTMSVTVTWKADPSVNLPNAGVFEQKINKICFSPDRVIIITSLIKVEIGVKPLSALIQPSPNSGTNTPVVRQGYMTFTQYGQYLASSDGK